MDFSPVFGNGLTINQRVTSGELNQLDADHVASLNRHGGTIDGYISILSGGTLDFQTGSNLEIDSNLTISPLATLTCDGILNINAPGVLRVNSGAFVSLNSGSAMTVHGSASINVNSTGVIQINNGGIFQMVGGGIFQTTTTDTVLIQANTSNFSIREIPQFVTAQSKITTQDCADGMFDGQQSLSPWSGGYANATLSNNNTSRSSAPDSWFIFIRPHNGSTLSQVAVTFQLTGLPRAGVPSSSKVKFSIFRRAINGINTDNLMSTQPVAIADAFYSNSLGTVASVLLLPDQNNVIDTSTYSYFLRIDDDYGSSNSFAGNAFIQVQFGWTNITQFSWST